MPPQRIAIDCFFIRPCPFPIAVSSGDRGLVSGHRQGGIEEAKSERSISASAAHRGEHLGNLDQKGLVEFVGKRARRVKGGVSDVEEQGHDFRVAGGLIEGQVRFDRSVSKSANAHRVTGPGTNGSPSTAEVKPAAERPRDEDEKSGLAPDRGRIRLPIRDATVGPVGSVQRRARIAIRAGVRANVSPDAPTSGTMSNWPAVSINGPLSLRHPPKICCRRHGNRRKAQGCACEQAGNKLLHCNPRCHESDVRTLHVGARKSRSSMAE